MKMLNILGLAFAVIALLSFGVFVIVDCFSLIKAFSWRELFQAIINITMLYIVYYAFYNGAKKVIE